MYYVTTIGTNDFEIELSKLGITVRKLNNEEKKEFISRYEKVIRIKNKFYACVRAHDDGDFVKFRKLKAEIDMDDHVVEYLFSEWRFNMRKPIFHRGLNSLFDKVMVISVDGEKLQKYVEKEDFALFLSQFFKMSYIYDETGFCDGNNDKTRLSIRRYNLSPIDELIVRFLFDDLSSQSHHMFVASRYLKKYCEIMREFISGLNFNDIFRFIEIIEMHSMKSGFKPSLVVNNILIIESLIVKDDKDLAKEFVRKTALFLMNGDKKYELKQCVTILDYLYKVRSDIVHGNTAKLFTDFSQLKSDLPNLKYPSMVRVSKMYKKVVIVNFTYAMSCSILNDILKLWFENPTGLEFVKKI